MVQAETDAGAISCWAGLPSRCMRRPLSPISVKLEDRRSAPWKHFLRNTPSPHMSKINKRLTVLEGAIKENTNAHRARRGNHAARAADQTGQ